MLHGATLAGLQGLTDHHALHAVAKGYMAELVAVRAHAAHVGHAQEAFLFKSGDDKTDVVHMGAEHYLFPIGIGALLDGNQVAHNVGFDAVHVAFQRLADGLGYRLLIAGGAIRLECFFQKLIHGFVLPFTISHSAEQRLGQGQLGLHVAELAHRRGAVDRAAGHREHQGGHAAPGQLNGACVVAAAH